MDRRSFPSPCKTSSVVSVVVFLALYACIRHWRLSPPPQQTPSQQAGLSVSRRLPACDDPVWCAIPIPEKSFFHFGEIDDPQRWEQAKIDASSGRKFLLERIIQRFPNQNDFLDGDTGFRSLHKFADILMDNRNYFIPLTKNHQSYERSKANAMIPPPYEFRGVQRAPIVQVGFFAFQKSAANIYFDGRISLSQNIFISKQTFFDEWMKAKDAIDTPFIAIMTLNENWGWFSTGFPNRTIGWGACCSKPVDAIAKQFLDHPKTLALFVNQHMNMSHPKLISWPRGMPLNWVHTTRLIWDAMRSSVNHNKETLLMAAASTWGPRPQILKCVSKKFSVKDFEGHLDSIGNQDATKLKSELRENRRLYYERLSSGRFGLCLPGLGYDTFRAWEYLTMGAVAVLEKSVGFERTMWRLPALFVEDFNDLTPDLLRSAYVEAIYRKDEFEFHRLKMSFWWDTVMNISYTRSSQPLLDTFPMEAEDPNFTRPRVPFDCWTTSSCGAGTKRIPKASC